MTNKEKIREIINSVMQIYMPSRYNVMASYSDLENIAMQTSQWKDEQLDSTIDKALERNGEFLKAGKITQYGYDMAFVTIQNIREYLKQ